ncbi:MAG: hypothetical protein NT120_00595 [Candidatus Aenigmarchaeota archaeon]|nr:hypothetical protein [Candidatus Aenigmarchaeota archaeon]
MKKSTQKTLMAVIIIFVFGGSILSFAALSFFDTPQTNQQQITSNIVNGPIDQSYQSTYVQNGFTWIKFYYTTADQNFISFMESLPSTLTTVNGQPQIILEKINSTYTNETNYIIISNRLGDESFADLSEEKVMESLCRLLTVTPLECGLINITLPTDQNTTSQ